MTRGLRTVFMGTPEIAVPALRVLSQLTTVGCVITQPDRPAGRGHHLHASAIKACALELGIPVWQPDTLRDMHADSRLECDLIVVMAYGELLREPLLERPRFGCINLHASLLPRWRGASPLQAALRAGDASSGVTVMRMVRGLDAGPIHLTEVLPGISQLTLPQLHDHMAAVAARALERFLTKWPPPPPTPQDESQVTTCRKLTSLDGHLDFTLDAPAICRWVRAYTPVPGCWVLAQQQRLRILEVVPRPLTSVAPGVVTVVEGELLVGCRDGALAVTRLQAAGTREMDARDYLNGHQLPSQFD